jgi:hypothetical protein
MLSKQWHMQVVHSNNVEQVLRQQLTGRNKVSIVAAAAVCQVRLHTAWHTYVWPETPELLLQVQTCVHTSGTTAKPLLLHACAPCL